MLPHVSFGMVLRRLRNSFHGEDLRQDFWKKAGNIEQLESSPCAPFTQHFVQFVRNAFAAHLMSLRRQLTDGRKRRRLDLIPQSRREANRAQQPELIFGKAPLGIANRSNDACFDIPAPTNVVENLITERIEQ